MALFGDEDGDVGPFVMGEGGEEWFPFTLDNLEMDIQDDTVDQNQDVDGETDKDDDVDGRGASAGASGPEPPPSTPTPTPTPAPPHRVGSSSGRGGTNGWDGNSGSGGGVACDQQQQQQQQSQLQSQQGLAAGGAGESVKLGARTRGPMDVVPEPKGMVDRVKPEAKEVHACLDRKRLTTEAPAPAKRTSRDKSGGAGSSSSSSSAGSGNKNKPKRRHAGGMAGGVGGMTGEAEGRGGGGGGGGGGDRGTTKASKSGSGGSITKPPAVQNRRRLERNAREQKRSLKISQHIEDLRRMLSQFGVDVKTSKSAVLSEATEYIAHLQRQHAQSEAERARILQLLHNATSGAAPFSAVAAAAAASAAGGGVGLSPERAAGMPAYGRTLEPPLSGAPLLPQEMGMGGPTPASSAAAAVVAAAAMQQRQQQQQQQQQRQQQIDAGFPAEGRSDGQAMLSGSLMPLRGDDGIARQTTAAAAEAVAGLPHQQLEVVPGFPGLSAEARSGVAGIMPVQPSIDASTLPVSAMGSVAGVGGGGKAAVTAAMANLGATARALSHVNYERVFRTAPMPMAIANVNGNLVDCNARLSQVTGFRRDEVLFMTIFDLVADPYLQHTFSMISSILSMRGVTNAPFFQVPGKHRSGGPGGVVQISAVHDEQLRPMHFSICILDSPTSGGASSTPAAGGASAFMAGSCGNGGSSMAGTPLVAVGGMSAGSGCASAAEKAIVSGPLVTGSRGDGSGGGGSGVVRTRGNIG